jgi:secreted Zn-dependent insulinase-like peptidase
MERALDDYPRLMALRVDLKFPQLREREDLGYLMTDFIRSLQSQMALLLNSERSHAYPIVLNS